MSNVLSRIVGNDSLKKRLAADIRNDTLAHAYIIEGRKGCGKHTVARAIAAAVNCELRKEQPASAPCGVCTHCKRILSDLSQDILTVAKDSGKATLGVDAVRDLRKDVATVPGELDRKVYLIEDADTMTVQAQNALLLTLEEPPPFVLFLLLCENARSLLETIRSRAPTLRVEPLSKDRVDRLILECDPRAKLVKSSAKEEYDVILTVSDGSVGEALRLLDSKERRILMDQRAQVTSVVDACLARKSEGELLLLTSALPQKRPELIAFLSLLMTAIRDLIALTRADHPHLCFYESEEKASERAANASLSMLAQIYRSAEDAIDALLRNASVPLTLARFVSAISR